MSLTVAAGVGILSKLIGLGMKGWKALDDKDLDQNDVEALRSMLETGSSIAGMKTPGTAAAAAVHLALVTRAFGQAVGRHQEFHGKVPIGGSRRLRRFFDREERDRLKEIDLRLQQAAVSLQSLGNNPRGEIELVDSLRGTPLATPYYRKLWDAFSNPALDVPGLDGDAVDPPLVMSATARREFERYFLVAYLAAAASSAGTALTAYTGGLGAYRRGIVRDALLADMAAWGGRHVFGNIRGDRWTDDDVVPFLPLDTLYVEPAGAIEAGDGRLGEPEPLLDLVRRLVTAEARKIVVVTADFGFGKSLSARRLARDWSEQFLVAPGVSFDQILPIHIRCADDFPHEAVDLPGTIRRAWKRLADDIDLSVTDDDDAFAWPDKQQKVVVLLDGLDEVALGEQHLRTLFQKLKDKATDRHRFVVLSRPGALPSREDLKEVAVVVRVQPFDPARVGGWLDGWNALRANKPAVELAVVEARGLMELAQTPILLFMVAFTWEHHRTSDEETSQAALYEHFFMQIARGKAETDKARHEPIAKASEALLAELKNRKDLPSHAELPDAMLWLMGRVAWEAHKLDQLDVPEALTRRHVDNILQEREFKLPPQTSDAVRLGLVLALQADLRGGNHPILFGHQSFREFLVGRYWAMQLHKIVRGRDRDWAKGRRALMGGALMILEDRSFEFLMQIVNADIDDERGSSWRTWTSGDRDVLVRWAQETFEDETILRLDGGPATIRDDDAAALREAALAIGSSTRGSPGLQAAHPHTLRSLLGWGWTLGADIIVNARALRHPEAYLSGARMSGADLRHANLEAAFLDDADLSDALLSDANLRRAHMFRANLHNAIMSRVDLSSAQLLEASLWEAYLDGASFVGATLVRANLYEAIAPDANFKGANLRGASLVDAQLEGATFERADLGQAGLRGAQLTGARLIGAQLHGANLAEADLVGANLTGANLKDANLAGARHDATTRWPMGFMPPSE